MDNLLPEASDEVVIYLDESTVVVCRAHSPCEWDGKATGGHDCDRLYLYGVGACAFESPADRNLLQQRLGVLRERITSRNGLAMSRRAARFARDGWHATEDLPEYADPLLFEIDIGSDFKGHVRFTASGTALVGKLLMDVYLGLTQQLAHVLNQRYRRHSTVRFVFEAGGVPLVELKRAIPNSVDGVNRVILSEEGKGNDLLALADYLLYGSLKYASINAKCRDSECETSHRVPAGERLIYDAAGAPRAAGHVGRDDRFHRFYFAFARNMSSVHEVALANVMPSDSQSCTVGEASREV